MNFILALTMLIPLCISLLYGDGDAGTFLYSFLITASFGGVMFLVFRTPNTDISHREGFIIVGFTWISVGFFSSLPYLISGVFPSLVDCIFEAVSGITTTGASIASDIGSLSRGLLFWRAMTNWLGGMGIIVLSLTILPVLGVGGMQIYKAEASKISGERLAPRIKDMARILLSVYLTLSVAMAVLLVVAGMGVYDAVLHTLAGMSTGGFSNQEASIGGFANVYVECVVMLIMVIGATNFALHYGFLKSGLRSYAESEEFRFYVLVMVVATAAVAVNLHGAVYSTLSESVRYASFQVISITTTTGFSSADFGSWPAFSQVLLVGLMFFGGSAGSTTGAIKCVRILLIIKVCYKELYKLVHPHAVSPVKLGGRVVPPEVLRSVLGFAFLFFMVFAVSAGALAWIGLEPLTAVSSAAATLGNIGPALAELGPTSNYSMVPDAAKWVMLFNMLLGRLEIYTLLILLVPAFWRG